jgi:hypothetical protein
MIDDVRIGKVSHCFDQGGYLIVNLKTKIHGRPPPSDILISTGGNSCSIIMSLRLKSVVFDWNL